MNYKKVRVKTVNVRVFAIEMLRLGALGAVITDSCHVSMNGLFKTADVLVPEAVDVGDKPEVVVLAGLPVRLDGSVVEQETPKKEDTPVEESKPEEQDEEAVEEVKPVVKKTTRTTKAKTDKGTTEAEK